MSLDTDPRERPLPPDSIRQEPDDPSWMVSFHSLDGRRHGWFLLRAADRNDARLAAAYQLGGDELLDDVEATRW